MKEMHPLSEILINLSIFVCVFMQKYTTIKEEDKIFWNAKYFVGVREWTWSMCCAFLFFSAHKTSPPTFTACGLVSEKSIGLCFSCCLFPLSEFAALPLVPALEAQNRISSGEGGGGGDYGKGTGLAPEHQHPDCPVPFPPSNLEVSGRARWGGGAGVGWLFLNIWGMY